jgi:hypothetical protein
VRLKREEAESRLRRDRGYDELATVVQLEPDLRLLEPVLLRKRFDGAADAGDELVERPGSAGRPD